MEENVYNELAEERNRLVEMQKRGGLSVKQQMVVNNRLYLIRKQLSNAHRMRHYKQKDKL